MGLEEVYRQGLQPDTPLNEYNAAFHRLQKHQKMKPVSSKDILTSASPTMMTSNANSESSTVPNPTMTHLHPMSITSLSFVQSDTLDTVLDEIIIDEEVYYRWY